MKRNCPITRSFFALLFVWLCSGSSLLSQVKFILPQLHADPGQTIEVPVMVANFSNVKGMQFTLHWDSTYLAYVGVGDFNLNSLDANDFGTAHTHRGDLTFAWIDQSLEGESLPDSSAIFTVSFQVIAQSDVATPIVITDSPTAIEVTDGVEIFQVEIHNGMILIGNVVGTDEPILALLSEPWPNPFSHTCQISGALHTAGPLSWELHDATGRIIYREEAGFITDRFSITVTHDLLPQAGNYSILIRVGNRIAAIRKLIYIP